MAESIDLTWFESIADDAATMNNLAQIARRQQTALQENRLAADETPLCLHLAGQHIWTEWGAAFSAMEIYQEIFRDNDHAKLPGFLDGLGGGTILDIGANFGFFALRLKRDYPESRLCCVEANPYVYSYLSRNIRENTLAEVTTLHAAVAGKTCSLSFDYIRQLPAISGRGLATVPRKWMREEFIESVTVPGKTLGAIMADCGCENISLLKLDVEGMEVEVLEAAKGELPRISKAVIEYHSDALRDGVTALMEDQGFTLLADMRPANSAYYGDLYFLNSNTQVLAT